MWHTLEQLLSAGPSLSETEVALRWQQAIRMLSALGPEQQLQLRALALNHGLLQLPVAGGGPGEGGEGALVLSPTELASPGEAESTKQSSRRYESQKRRDWNTFGQYLKNHRPPIPMSRCTPQHVVDFLRYLDQFGKTKVHNRSCHFHGSNGSHPCGCPMRQAWGSLDSLVGRLRAAYEENGGTPENNPFGARLVRTYLRETRDHQAKARGIAYEKKKRKRPSAAAAAAARAVPGELPFLPGSSAVEPLQLRA